MVELEIKVQEYESIYLNYKAKRIIIQKNNKNEIISSMIHYRERKDNKNSIIITSGYYDYWIHQDISDELFEKNNFNVYIIDFNGMGTAIKNNKKENYKFESINKIIDNINVCFEEINIFNNNSEYICWLSHSFGSLLALRYYKLGKYADRINKYILNGPLLSIKHPIINILLLLGKIPFLKDIDLMINKKESINTKYCYQNNNIENAYDKEMFYKYKPKFVPEITFGFLNFIKENMLLFNEEYIHDQDKGRFIVILSKSYDKKENNNDNVLIVNDIKRTSEKMGINVISIENALHDVFSSIPEIRKNAIEILFNEINTREYS